MGNPYRFSFFHEDRWGVLGKAKNREVSLFKQKVKQHDNKQRRTAPEKEF